MAVEGDASGSAPTLIADGIWRVGGGSWNDTVPRLTAEADGNSYLLCARDRTLLVDCGTLAGLATLERNLRAVGRDPRAVTDLIVTHSHWDHTEAAAEFQSRADRLTTHAPATAAEFLARDDHRLVGYQIYDPPHVFRPFATDHAVGDGTTFALGDASAQVFAVPGHTPDSTLYLLEHRGRRVGIVGDVCFAPLRDGRSVLGHLCRLWLSDLDHYVQSLKRLVAIPIDILLPGHGPGLVGEQRVREAAQRALHVAESLARDRHVRDNLGI